MKTNHLVFLLIFLLFIQQGYSQCATNQQQVVFVDGTYRYLKCILKANAVANCGGYDAKVPNFPYKCITCNKPYFMIYNFDLSPNPKCVKTSTNFVSGCQLYTSAGNKCYGCLPNLTPLPTGTVVNGKKEVLCQNFPLIQGDGVRYADCLEYRKVIVVIQCKKCAALDDGFVPKSADCSRVCHTTGLLLKSAFYYMDGLIEKSTCSVLPQQPCLLYSSNALKGCLRCDSGYSQAYVGAYVGPILGKYLFCIRDDYLIPGCYVYSVLKPDTCIKCDLLDSTAEPNTNLIQLPQNPPEVTEVYYPGYETCAPDPSYIIGYCKAFKPNGLGCSLCEVGYELITKYFASTVNGISSSLTQCVKKVFFCESYNFDRGFCQICIPRYYLVNQVCYKVDDNCLQYDRKTGVCNKCAQKYIPSTSKLGKCQIDVRCQNGYYFDTNENKCLLGKIQNCQKYQLGGQNCVTCKKDYVTTLLGTCKFQPQIICPVDTNEIEYIIVQKKCRQKQKVCSDYRLNQEDQTRVYCFDCQQGWYANNGLCNEF